MKATSKGRRALIGLLALATGAGVGLVATAGTAQSAHTNPAAVYSSWKNHHRLSTGANGQTVVGRLAVPAGSWTISAKLNLDVPSGGNHQTIMCYLRAGGDYDRAIANHNGVLAHVPMSLNVVHNFSSPGTVYLTCGHVYTAGTTDLSFIKMTGVKASYLSNRQM
ncbi:hypothetical protein ACFPM3_19555 [Streptomyces coeruleoprunus]|uniref:Secreted protein n=1 Tax=Streptomyces coeruleoprunus TaxID=285563 RepID=A0ABV9XH69_9ACTN